MSLERRGLHNKYTQDRFSVLYLCIWKPLWVWPGGHPQSLSSVCCFTLPRAQGIALGSVTATPRLDITEDLDLGGIDGTDTCVSLRDRNRTLGSHLDHLGIGMSSLVPTVQTYFKKQHHRIVERCPLRSQGIWVQILITRQPHKL